MGNYPQTLVHVDWRDDRLLQPAGLLRGRGVPHRAAHPADRCRPRTARVLYTQEGHSGRQTAMAIRGRHATGLHLGHGAYQAPDWTADWLHRELLAWLETGRAAERMANPSTSSTPTARPCCVPPEEGIPHQHL